MRSLSTNDPERQAAREDAAVARALQIAVLIGRAIYGEPPEAIRKYLKLDERQFEDLRYEATGVARTPWRELVFGTEKNPEKISIEVPLRITLNGRQEESAMLLVEFNR
jgi:hypothetical protein